MLYFKILIFLLTVIFTVVFGTPTRGHSLHRSAFSASETQNSGSRNKTETPEESSESESSEEDQDEGIQNRTMTMPLQNHMPPTTASPPRQVIQAAVGSVKAETTRTPSKPTFDHEEESQYGNIVGSDSGRGSCGSRFLPTSMSRNITRKCIDLIGFRMDNFPPKEEDLVKINYEDKCFSKCYLNELNYFTSGDNFDANRIEEEIKKETPQNKWEGRLDATRKCLKKTAEMATEEGGVANSPCKYALVFFVCAREAERRMVC